MMKIITSLLILFFCSTSLQARVSDVEFEAIKADHQLHFKKPALYIRAEDELSPTSDPIFVVMTGAELNKLGTRGMLFHKFESNPQMTLLLDVALNDGLVDDAGALTLRDSDVFGNLTAIWLSNLDQSVRKIKDCFMSNGVSRSSLTKLTSASFSPFLKLTKISCGFFYCCTGLVSFRAYGWPELTHIDDLFFSDCTSLINFTAPDMTKLTEINCRFFSGCTSLKIFDARGWSQLRKIGRQFFDGCKGLTSFDARGWAQLKEIDAYFFDCCEGLTSFNASGWNQLEQIGEGFFHRCTGLTSFNASGWAQLREIGHSFFSGCSGLTSFNASGWTQLREIGDWFFYSCTGLTSFTPSGWTQLREIGKFIFIGCAGLIDIQKPELAHPLFLEKITGFLRNSNNPAQQELGAALYQTYVLSLNPALKNLQDELHLDRLKGMTPQPLIDLKIPDYQVPRRFRSLWHRLCQNAAHAPILTEHQAYFWDHFMPQITNLFVNPTLKVTWTIREEYRPEMRIAFKHILKKLQTLMSTAQAQAEAVTYMTLMLQAFAHCESRYVSATNQVLMQMGLSTQPEPGVKGKLIQLINDIKLEAYMNMRSTDNDDGAHNDGRHFTVVNNAIGLPVAVRSFQEKMSHLSDDEMQEILGNFLGGWFNKDAIIEAMRLKFEANPQPLKRSQIRGYLGQIENKSIVQKYTNEDDDDFEAYYRELAGIKADEAFNMNTTPISKGEIERLLTRMGVFTDLS